MQQRTFFDQQGWEAHQEENPSFLSDQIITYLGNKRALLGFLEKGIDIAKRRLGAKKISCCDLFSGSGTVSRFLKRHSSKLVSNDLEDYCLCLNKCYLTNKSEIDQSALSDTLKLLKKTIAKEFSPGFITELYAPKDDANIQPGERVFYTRRNATYIDTARTAISRIPSTLQDFFLAPLLYEASVHNNTSGVFKGFYKNKAGIGQFGGEGKNALTRIMGEIELRAPVFSNFECEVEIMQHESEVAVEKISEIDFCYMDPPYNQHPYGSNYFMLNLILHNKRPADISAVSGIPTNWNRSPYNKQNQAKEKLFRVISKCPAKFILISYNGEGFIKQKEFLSFLSTIGSVTPLETDYNVFRGSRNLRNRNTIVKEFLFLLEKK